MDIPYRVHEQSEIDKKFKEKINDEAVLIYLDYPNILKGALIYSKKPFKSYGVQHYINFIHRNFAHVDIL